MGIVRICLIPSVVAGEELAKACTRYTPTIWRLSASQAWRDVSVRPFLELA